MKITLTKTAADEIKKMQKAEKKAGYVLKFDIFPGGCAGFQYYMDFIEKSEKDDVVTKSGGITIAIPKESIPLIDGCKIHFIKEADGFKIKNPNLKENSGYGGGCCENCGGGCR